MYLLKHINTTNPNASIVGVCILNDEQLNTFNTNIETIKTTLTPDKLFLVPVGEGYILIDSIEKLEQSYIIIQIQESDLLILQTYGIDYLGFAQYFVSAVINLSNESFADIPQSNPETEGGI